MSDDATVAALFDLDGVLTDTAEHHFQSWLVLARELEVPFDRRRNDALRGLSREESLATLLGPRFESFTSQQRAAILHRKNELYLQRVDRMTPADVLPGARELLAALRARGVRTAVGSSSRNARRVIDRLEIGGLLDAVVDGNDAPRSKPDPMVFRMAAEALGIATTACVVLEDAASGVQAARAAGMRVIGVGPAERVAGADRVVPGLARLTADDVISLATP